MADEADASTRNYAGITTRDQAEKLVAQGALEWVQLLPAEFGGSDDPKNQVALPKGVAREKRRVDDGTIKALMDQGKVSKYTAEPVYEGASFIPVAIKIQASEPGSFSATVGVWGSGLAPAGKPGGKLLGKQEPARPAPKGQLGGADKEFKLVRSAPAALDKSEGMGVAPLIIVGVLVLGGGAAWFATRGPAKDDKKPPVAATDGPATTTDASTSTEEDPPAVKVFIANRLEWLEEQGNLQKAVQEAEEKLKEYPKAPGLQRKLEELRRKAGSPGPAGRDLGAELAEAGALVDQGRFADGIAKLDALLDESPPDIIAGPAYFARAVAYAKLGQKLEAQNDVESAAAAKFDPARCDQLRAMIGAMP